MGDDDNLDAAGDHRSANQQPFELENFFNLKKLSMTVVKYSILFGWSLVLLSMVIFIVRSHPFLRRKKEADLNLSEAIYVMALLVTATLVLIPLLQTLAVDFDVSQKFYPDKCMVTLISSGSLISLAGMGIFVLLFVTARGLSTLFFFGQNPLIEFSANNISYSLLRAGLVLSLSLLLSPLCSPIFQYLMPAITNPFTGERLLFRVNVVSYDEFGDRFQSQLGIDRMIPVCRIKFIVFSVFDIPNGADRICSDGVRLLYFPEVHELVGVQWDNQSITVFLAGDGLIMVPVPEHASSVSGRARSGIFISFRPIDANGG